MPSVSDIVPTHDFSGDPAGDPVVGELQSELTRIVNAHNALLVALDKVIDDDDTLADNVVRTNNLHEEVSAVLESNGFTPKESARVASKANVDIVTGGLLTIDGVALNAGDRVLLVGQTDPVDNGIYVAAVGGWPRATDFDSAADLSTTKHTIIAVDSGGDYGGTAWSLLELAPAVGTDAQTWFFFRSQSIPSADSVSTSKIQDGAVTLIKIATGTQLPMVNLTANYLPRADAGKLPVNSGLSDDGTSITAYRDLDLRSALRYYDPVVGDVPYTLAISGALGARISRLRNYVDDPTLLALRSKAGDPLVATREATLALVRTDDAGNEEYIDLYNNGYHGSGSKIAVAHGLRVQKRGTGQYRNFYFDWYDGSAVTDGFNITYNAGNPLLEFAAGFRMNWAGGQYLDGVDTDVNLAANSNTKIAPQRAVKSYVDAGLATKSNTGHTHTHVSITDFDAEVDARIAAIGQILTDSQNGTGVNCAINNASLGSGTWLITGVAQDGTRSEHVQGVLSGGVVGHQLEVDQAGGATTALTYAGTTLTWDNGGGGVGGSTFASLMAIRIG